MKRRRLRKEKVVGPRGYSRWIHPTPDGYLMGCCDCGLVHEMQFRAFVRGPSRRDGEYRYEILPKAWFGVRFRARRRIR